MNSYTEAIMQSDLKSLVNQVNEIKDELIRVATNSAHIDEVRKLKHSLSTEITSIRDDLAKLSDNLSHFAAAQKPLFDTVDGVEIYPGDDYYILEERPGGGYTGVIRENLPLDFLSGWIDRVYSTQTEAELAYKKWRDSQNLLSVNDLIRELSLSVGEYSVLRAIVDKKLKGYD